ncbi:AAA family ATPase [Candidatus Sumerlaeota bacterium]|nr:AAA family ATPase [Candidatus Sumerlaeota bacterium]
MKLQIKNFRAVQEQEIELAPMTVVYGPNGAGKSSLLYALLTMKNVVLNPNQAVDGFFNYGFVNLGDFAAVVFDHRKEDIVHLALSPGGFELSVELDYTISFGKNTGAFEMAVVLADTPFHLSVSVSFPYPANKQVTHKGIIWNGITAEADPRGSVEVWADIVERAAIAMNYPTEILRKVSIVPLKRGFSKPHYSPVPTIPAMLRTEDEVATLLANDKYLVEKVGHYLERITGRDLKVNVRLGTAIFSLDSRDRSTGVGVELVNEGFGVSQLADLLARSLHPDAGLVCIEEPEIHLHPTAIRNLARCLADIAREEKKTFLISTHSESFVSALLTLVVEGRLAPSDLACYLAQKKGKCSTFERQEVNDKGQIKGGLASFIQAEMEDLKILLNVSE